MRKEDECCRHTNLEEASKIDIKNIYSVPVQYPQQKWLIFQKKLSRGVFTSTKALELQGGSAMQPRSNKMANKF